MKVKVVCDFVKWLNKRRAGSELTQLCHVTIFYVPKVVD